MTREVIISKTMENLSRLPDHSLKEVSDFAEFLLFKIENQLLTEGIQQLATQSTVYKFLETEENLYKVSDLKEKYR